MHFLFSPFTACASHWLTGSCNKQICILLYGHLQSLNNFFLGITITAEEVTLHKSSVSCLTNSVHMQVMGTKVSDKLFDWNMFQTIRCFLHFYFILFYFVVGCWILFFQALFIRRYLGETWTNSENLFTCFINIVFLCNNIYKYCFPIFLQNHWKAQDMEVLLMYTVLTSENSTPA